MGNNYKKIKYQTQGNFASTEEKYLFVKSNRSSDIVSFYDNDGNFIFSFDEWGDFDKGEAIKVALTNWNDERMEDVSPEEIKNVFNKKNEIEETEYESPYCKICSGCGEDGCCSALICQQHPEGSYCQTYLRDLKYGYKMFDEIDKILPNDEEFKKKYEEIFHKVYDLIYKN